jgi:hypothetical protein
MDEENKGGRTSTLSIPVILLISALAGSLFLGPSALITSRPEGAKRKMTGTLGTQDVEARLWQDPFEALELAGVTSERKQDVDVVVTEPPRLTWKATASVDAGHEIEQLARQIDVHYLDWNPEATGYDKHTIPLNKEVHMILAMVSGGPYPEDVESRIRSRVALMAALGTAGYRSEDEEQIGYVTSDWPLQIIRDGSGWLTKDGSSRLVLPYEWFIRRIHHPDSPQSITPRSNHVLVLWLRDDMFADEPLYRLNELIGCVRQNVRDDRLKISILGPHTSTTLRAFFSPDEWDHPPATDDATLARIMRRQLGCSNDWLTNTKIFSPAATTMEGLLVPSGEKPTETGSQIQRRLKTLGIDFFNVTSTDDALASTLLAELARREVDPGKGQNHIALITEWDTFYGRTIPLTFAYKLEQLYRNQTPSLLQQLRFSRGEHSKQLHSFSYLQGIDGNLPASSPQMSPEPKTGSESAKAKERKTPEANRAEGPSQLDYIPRLADHIAQENQRLFIGSVPVIPLKKKPVEEIRAIGVMGSDLYDKLLALQALRPRFPNAIFFTTDLDARLWHPNQLKWTRNMVVASSFGLELQPELQQDIPPFRDSYQTAEYLGCLSALGLVSTDTLKCISPRLFEIGRNGAVDLSAQPGATPAQQGLGKAFISEWQSLRNPPPDDPIYPRTRMRLSWNWTMRVVVWLAISGALALLLLGRVSPLLRRFVTGRKQALRREIFIKAEDIRDEAKLVTSLRKWFPGSPWEDFLSDGFKKALGLRNQIPPQASAPSSPDLTHSTRITIIDGLNKLIERRDLPLITTASLPVTNPAKQQSASEPRPKEDWLRRMIQNRRTIEGAALGALFSFEYPFALTRRSLSNFARFGWIAPAAMLLVLLLAVMDNQASGVGEPFSWTNGVSAWPSQFIRLLAVALAIAFILRGEEDLKRNQLELSRRFMLPDGEKAKRLKSKRISDWLHFAVAVKAKVLWLEYRWLGRRVQRAKRIIPMSAIYFFSLFFLATAFGQLAPNPIRGVVCHVVNLFLLAAAIITTILLNFFVVDATRLCQRFIQNLSNAPTIYPPATLRKFCGGIEPAADDDLDEWLDMKIIAGRSAEVSKLIYYPFITLLLLIAARAGYWDDWAWQPVLILIFVLNIAWAVSSALVLQRSAKQAKTKALESVRKKLCLLPEKGSEQRIKRLNKIQEDISAMNSGAFAGYLNNPILGALSLPVMGTIIALAIEFLTNG